MRHTPAGSFDRLTSLEALWAAWRRFAQGKRRTPRVARFDLEADGHLLRLHRELRAGTWRPGPIQPRLIRDPKPRVIVAAPVRDRVVHQALIGEVAPWFEQGFLDDQFGCRTGRGPQRAVLRHLAFTRRYAWRLHLDIRAYFPSIDHATLCRLYAARERDPRTLALLARVITQGTQAWSDRAHRDALGLSPTPPPCRGVPIGSLVSHFSGALYLNELDHHIKRALHIPGYLRYMDDLVLFHDDRAALESAHAAVVAWLATERHLIAKPAAVTSTRQASIFLGWRVTRAGLSPAPKLLRNVRRKVRAAAAAGPDALARALHSYRGLITL